MKILIKTLLIVFLLTGVVRSGSRYVFNAETVPGATHTQIETSTSTGYFIDGATTIGYAFRANQGTSAPHVSVGYQTSMNKSSWTATTIASSDTSVTTYTSTGTAITIPPVDWIRWILRSDFNNATDTTFDLWFREGK